MKKKHLLLVATSMSVVTFLSCGNGAKSVSTSTSDTTKTAATTTQTATPATPSGNKMGQDVKAGDLTVKVLQMKDYKSTNPMLKTEEGDKLVALEIECANTSTDKNIETNPMDWSASDDKSYSYNFGMTDKKQPSFNGKTLNPGGKVRGWITFAIPKDNKLVKVQYKDMLSSDAGAEIDLQ